jgi:DNA-binding MarR family transcriptional regulator
LRCLMNTGPQVVDKTNKIKDDIVDNCNGIQGVNSVPLDATKNGNRVAHHPGIHDIRDLLTFRIAMIAAASDRVGQRWLSEEFDFRILEWRILGVVAALEPVRFLKVAETLLVDKGQLSRLMKSLSERGLIDTEADPDDLRTIRLRVTEEGRAVHGRVLARALERNELFISALEPGELATLFALLEKLQPFIMNRAEQDSEV